MSRALAYSAAEYFIEGLKENSTFIIDYHGINSLLQHASQDINSYFKKEGKDDVFFIFKQFPDVFILNECDITLTDAFLALCAFPESAEFRATYESPTVFETSVIEYFKLILIRCVMCNYLTLFNTLFTQNKLLASYCSYYTEADMYAFFQKHANTFALINGNVYLNRAAPRNFNTFDDHFCEKSLKKLIKATNFLLTCFKSLHYIELRQVISFVISDVMEYLNMYSLIKQREIFENLPNTVMNKMGYLSLKNFELPLPDSKKLKLVLLIVCLLAFEAQIHFLKISDLIKKRMPSEVSSIFCNLSISEQFKYFKDLPDYFWIYDNGYVTLLPSFIFPFCSFDSNLPNAENYFLKLQQPSTFAAQSNIANIIEAVKHLSIAPHDNSNLENSIDVNVLPKDLASKDSSNILVPSTGLQSNNLVDLKGSFCLLEARLKCSMFFLMQSFQNLICKDILKSCLYVLNDVQVYFLKLSLVQQIDYLKKYNAFFDSLLKDFLTGVPSNPYINDRERILLFVVYVLISQKVILFEKLSWWLDFGKIDCAFSKFSVYDNLVYFKEMSDYLTVSVKGNISLNESFDSINTLVDSHYGILLKMSSKFADTTVTNNEYIPVEKEKLSNRLPKKNLFHDILPSAAENAVNQLNMPVDIYKKLRLSVICLKECFYIICTEDILRTFLYAVTDINAYFIKLSTTQQQEFILSYFQCMSSTWFNGMSWEDSQLTEKEKVILMTTYLLIQNKTMHHFKLCKKLKAFNISAQVLGRKFKTKLKCLKSLYDYFDIGGKGQVTLGSSYSLLMSIINPVLMNLQLKKKIIRESDPNIVSPDKAESEVDNKGIKNFAVSLDNEISTSSALNMIIDLSFFVLGLQEKMKVEKLSSYLSSFGIKKITSYFFFHIVTKKTKFFCGIPEYFEVSSDNFVSLKKNVVSSYVPKTSLIIQDNNGCFLCNNEMIAKHLNSLKSVTSDYLLHASDKLFVVSNSSADKCSLNKTNNPVNRNSQNIKKNIRNKKDSTYVFFKFAPIETNGKSILVSQNNGIPILSAEDVINVILDFSVSVLSVFEKIAVQSLCTKILKLYKSSSLYLLCKTFFDLKNIFRYIYRNRSEKLDFFLNYPKLFEISQNDFVSLKKNVVSSYVPKTNLIVQDCIGNFVGKNVEYFSFPESVTFKENKPTDDNSKNPSRYRCSITKEILKCLRDLLIPSKSTNTIEQKNSALKTKANTINQTVEHKFSNFSINESVNTAGQNYVSNSSHTINSNQTDFGDSSVSSADLQLKTYKKSIVYSRSSASYGTKHISEEIQCNHVLNYDNSITEIENANISSMTRSCDDRSCDYMLKQNLNKSALANPQSSVNDGDDKDLFSSDDDLDPYTLYGLELLRSFYGDSVPHTSTCTGNKIKSQNCPITCDIDNRKVSSALSSSSFGGVQDMKMNDQFLCKSIPSQSSVPLKQHPSLDIVEIQAVNFFSVILGNYATGVSADFLMEHLNLASENVQNFMMSLFQSDAVSFFMKHETIFYVSPSTKNIYLVKNT